MRMEYKMFSSTFPQNMWIDIAEFPKYQFKYIILDKDKWSIKDDPPVEFCGISEINGSLIAHAVRSYKTYRSLKLIQFRGNKYEMTSRLGRRRRIEVKEIFKLLTAVPVVIGVPCYYGMNATVGPVAMNPHPAERVNGTWADGSRVKSLSEILKGGKMFAEIDKGENK